MARRVARWVAATAALAITAGCGTPATDDPPRKTTTASTQADRPVLPDGWRWESFGGVAVGVPDDWGHGVAGEPWCLERRGHGPIVGRPGAIPTIACAGHSKRGPDPGSLLKFARPHVDFHPKGPWVPRSEGDTTTVGLEEVSVSVLAEKELRKRILATLHAVQRDHNDCPSDDPIASDPSRRPAGALDVTTLTGVTSVSACKYALPSGPRPEGASHAPLLSSLRLTGPPAGDVVRAIAAAPAGGGSARPQNCVPEVRYGEEVLVLHVIADQGAATIYARYSGATTTDSTTGEPSEP